MVHACYLVYLCLMILPGPWHSAQQPSLNMKKKYTPQRCINRTFPYLKWQRAPGARGWSSSTGQTPFSSLDSSCVAAAASWGQPQPTLRTASRTHAKPISLVRATAYTSNQNRHLLSPRPPDFPDHFRRKPGHNALLVKQNHPGPCQATILR